MLLIYKQDTEPSPQGLLHQRFTVQHNRKSTQSHRPRDDPLVGELTPACHTAWPKTPRDPNLLPSLCD